MSSNYNFTLLCNTYFTTTCGSINSLLSTFCESARVSSLILCNTRTNETLNVVLLIHRLCQSYSVWDWYFELKKLEVEMAAQKVSPEKTGSPIEGTEKLLWE